MTTNDVTVAGMQRLSNGLHATLGGLVCWGTIAIIGQTFKDIFWSFISLLIFTTIKEYWWDIHYETKETSGGYKGGVTDQAGYLVGWALAFVVFYLGVFYT